MAYEYITKYDSPNYSPGRPAGAPNVIVIHYWDRPEKKPSFNGVVNWLCRKNGTSSAHYVVEAGKVACIVAPKNRAWHAGPGGNPRGIGIECNPRMSAGDLETTAELIAALRKTYGNLPLRPHKHYMNTSCPGAYEGKLTWLSNRANQINAGSKPAASKPAAKPTSNKIAEDGYWGSGTTRRLQQVLGTTRDGVVSGQNVSIKSRNPGLTTGWDWRSGRQITGSQVIKAVQRRLGFTGSAADGILGPVTINALIRRYGYYPDGKFDVGSLTIKAMQKRLNAGSF